MYYYIFQSPKSFSENKIHERIKKELTLLGISGETTLVTPARSASELAMMGVEKGYSTIVAVGGDEIINEVASNIYGSGAVLGIIPINTTKEILDLIGTADIKTACESLQKRFLETINLGYLEPGVNFITKIEISSSKLLSIQAEINDFYFETRANHIVIDNDLRVRLSSGEKNSGLFDGLFNIFGQKKESADYSFFNAHRLRLRTHEIVPVKIGTISVAKTPIVAYRRPEALKIIKYFSKIK